MRCRNIYVLVLRGAKLNRPYTCLPDSPDPRDAKYSFVGPRQELPPSVDLRAKCPPVVDQGQIGSCTANALAGALGFLELNEQAAGLIGQALELAATGPRAFSRMFIYYNERDMEGDADKDGGAQIRDGVKSLASLGCCSEDVWPYKPLAMLFSASDTFKRPSDAAYVEASAHKISSYQSLDNADILQLKDCLSAGFPFVFWFAIFPSFENGVEFKGEMKMPGDDEEQKGAHAVMCVGYDDARQVFIVRNSWGSSWGDAGYFYMPYAFATDPDLAGDFWTLRK